MRWKKELAHFKQRGRGFASENAQVQTSRPLTDAKPGSTLSKSGLAIAASVIVLIGGAGMFKSLAPKNYGLMEIEVLEPGATGVRIQEEELFGNYYPAAGAGPHAGVLLLGGSEGGLGRGVKHMALALQREGFSVFQLAYFGAPGTPESLERIPLEAFDRGLAWLGAQPGVDAERLALVGASKGAEAVLLVATRHPALRAVVAGMPTSVAWNGINWRRFGQSPLSSWTSGGEEVPTMPYAPWNQAEGVLSVYRSVEDPDLSAAVERAAIPIERARCNVARLRRSGNAVARLPDGARTRCACGDARRTARAGSGLRRCRPSGVRPTDWARGAVL